MALLVVALLFLGMLVTFVVVAQKAPQKAPRAVVSYNRSPDLFVASDPHQAPRAAFPRGSVVYDGR